MAEPAGIPLLDEELRQLLWRRIRDVPDYPRPGILFKDIAPLLADPEAFATAVDAVAASGAAAVPGPPGGVTKVAGIEARGFLLAAPVAYRLAAGFVPVRKAGKLPGETLRRSYALEYGEATLEVQADAFAPGDRVLLVDDVLATGGTVEAAVRLVEDTGARVVAVTVLLELAALRGRERLSAATDVEVSALLSV